MTPTPEALADAARVLRYHAELATITAAMGVSPTNLSTVAAWLETQGWRPIADAPRQTIVMLYWPYWSHLPCFGSWQPHPTETRLRWISDVVLGEDGPGPTHWMTIPTPPETPDV